MLRVEIDDELSEQSTTAFTIAKRECGTCWLEDCTFIALDRTTDFIVMPP
jgi:hypothetical protein